MKNYRIIDTVCAFTPIPDILGMPRFSGRFALPIYLHLTVGWNSNEL